MTTLSGVWLPIVTPFHEGAVDFVSYDKLIEHYIAAGVSGIFPLARPAKARPWTTTKARRSSSARSRSSPGACRSLSGSAAIRRPRP